jgi:hypothetical protein
LVCSLKKLTEQDFRLGLRLYQREMAGANLPSSELEKLQQFLYQLL